VIVCACLARTPVDTLRHLMEALHASGTTVRGLVVWDREEPVASAPIVAAS
jgi:hypothetical protein